MEAEFRVWRGAACGLYVPLVDQLLNTASLPGLTVVIRITMMYFEMHTHLKYINMSSGVVDISTLAS